jgi:LPXTG-motif cell wall-anchored protein
MTASTGVSRPRTWLAALFSLVLVASMTMGLPAFATPDDHGGTDKVTICHATSSASNPYVVITVDPASIFQKGHDGHDGPVFDPATMGSGDHWGDIIPPFDYEYEQGQELISGHYAGLNWTAEGQAIWEAGCVAAPAEPVVGAVTVDKAWNLDAEAMARDLDLSATLDVRIDGVVHTGIMPGHTFTDLAMGTVVEIVGEHVAGLPESCAYTADLAGVAWTATESAPVGTITLTNVVTCEAEAALGEVTVVKAWDLDDAFDGMTEDDVYADLEVRIDGEIVGTFPSGHTFTDLEMGTLVEVIGEANVEVPEGCTYDNDLAGAAWTVTESAPVGTITLTNVVTCVLDVIIDGPAVTVEFAKEWSGDVDLEGVTAWLTVEGEAVAFGEVVDVTDLQGETLAITEQVEGLPEECTWESDLDQLDLTVPVADDEDLHYEVTVTNDVTCVLDEIVEPGDLTVTKEAIEGFELDDDGNKIVELDGDGEVELVYRFTISNVGDSAVELTSFEDTTFGDLLVELEGDTMLAAGEAIELDMVVWLTADDFVDGLHHNVVTVTGVDEEGLELIAEAEEFVWLVEVLDVIVERPVVDREVERVVVADRVVTQVAAQRPALPQTGASLLGLLLAGAFALTAGGAMTIIPRRRKR